MGNPVFNEQRIREMKQQSGDYNSYNNHNYDYNNTNHNNNYNNNYSNNNYNNNYYNTSMNSTINNQEVMTMNGTIGKIFILITLVALSACTYLSVFTGTNVLYDTVYQNNTMYKLIENQSMYAIFASIAAFILALVIIFKPKLAPVLSIIYAVLEGVVLGFISATYAVKYDGIVGAALTSTICVVFAMLLLYKLRILQATQGFKRIIFTATASIALLYLGVFIASFFNVNMEWFFGSSNLSIGISIVVIIVAALNLIIDFDNIELGSKSDLPKYMEWYAAFSLLITIIWIYIEILRLLAKLRNR